MWNDTEIPLAHLSTFRSYGTWLHGDKRGSVDRSHNNIKRLIFLQTQNNLNIS